ncbi:MAG: hypothetical protein ABEH78_08650 [Haloferacaceae archaeon]
MGVISRREFALALGSLDRERLAAFVADLWEQQGWETDVEGYHVVAERAGHRQRIRVVAGDDTDLHGNPTPPIGNPDLVVDVTGNERTATRKAGATHRSPSDVRDRLLYGVPRNAADRLCRRYCNRPLRREESSSDGVPIRGLASVLAVVAIVVVVGAVVVAGLPAPSSTDAGVRWPTQRVGAGTDDPSTTAPRSRYPAGLSPAGVTAPSKLAAAHVTTVKNRSYALDVTFDGPAEARGFEDWEHVRWSLRIERRDRYRVNATYRRAPDTDPSRVRLGVYADGETRFRRIGTPKGTGYVALPTNATAASAFPYVSSVEFDRAGVDALAGTTPRAFPHVASSLITRYLDTSESTVDPVTIDGDVRYHVIATGKPARLNDSVIGYRADAWVTPNGRVTSMTVRYTLRRNGWPRYVRFSFAYTDYRTARVEPPPWYGEGKNGSGT